MGHTINEKQEIERMQHEEIYRAETPIVDRRDFYLHGGQPETHEKTRARLTEIVNAGMTEVGVAEFGVRGVMSGLYIERVWNYTDDDWKKYMDWAKDLIKSKK